MKTISIGIIILIVIVSAFAQPDSLWSQMYGGDSYELGFEVDQTSDHGYIIVGYTSSFGAGEDDVYLVKTDSLGNEEWSRTYGESFDDWGHSVRQTSDGGYIITGYSGAYPNYNIYVIKTDALGNQMWTQIIGDSYRDEGMCIRQTSDGGYILTGVVELNGSDSKDLCLIKMNAFGEIQWNHVFGGLGYEEGNSVQQTGDGGYIVAGYTSSSGAGSWDVLLIKTDSLGNETWFRTYGGTSTENGECVQQTNDGGYIIAGYSSSFSINNAYEIYLIKTDASGNEQWSRNIGIEDNNYSYSVQQTIDGGYILAGRAASLQPTDCDVYIVKTDAFGNVSWYQTYGNCFTEYGRSVQQTNDGGFIVAGYYQHSPGGNYDFWLIKLESEWQMLMNITLTPLNPPIQIPVNGGLFDFNIAIENIDSLPYIVDIWTMATLPNSNVYGPIIDFPNFILNPGVTLNRDRTQTVPAGAPAGAYTYDAYIGAYPDLVLAEDHFDFEKSSTSDFSSYVHDWTCWGEGFAGEKVETYIPGETVLHSPCPNPFNARTAISYQLLAVSNVNLTVYDITGREVTKLVDGMMTAGTHQVVFDAKDLTSGVYFARLKAGNFCQTRKMLLIK